MNEETLRFVREHREDDVRQLALQAGNRIGTETVWALQQIAGWQKARRKLPAWAAIDGIQYPPQISMEQCSSEQTARYKARLAHRLCASLPRPLTLLDLTGGLGVDFSFMAAGFDKAVYVERQTALCETARHNFPLLGLAHAEVVCGDGTDFLRSLSPGPSSRLVYLDPARRDAYGQKTYAISDCTPDVLALKEELLDKASRVMVKLSPMLDWRQAVAALGCVAEVHIVSASNECKELLLVLEKGAGPQGEGIAHPTVYCANDDEVFVCPPHAHTVAFRTAEPTAGDHLYEPNASLMKAGCFGMLCERFGVSALGANSHLFTSRRPVDGFPGRHFEILAVTTMNKRDLRQALKDIRQANIAVRNFPLPAAELRRRLKLKDGGDTYIFGTTTSGQKHVLLITKKA